MRPAVRWLVAWRIALAVCVGVFGGLGSVRAARITMKDGRVLDGSIAKVGKMAENPNAQVPKEGVAVRSIVLIDDNLRRTFVPQRQIQEAGEVAIGEPEEKIFLRQNIPPRNGGYIGSVGPLVQIGAFDDFGRRLIRMLGPQGVVPMVQGITELTPEWAKVETLPMEGKNYIWDMRIATTSIPPADLDKILTKLTDPTKIDERLRVVRFYLQSQRFKDAEETLNAVVKDFPANQDQFAPTVIRLHQAFAKRALVVIEECRKAGQHQTAYALLNKFPAENVQGETLQQVRQLIDEYNKLEARRVALLKRLDADLAKINDSVNKHRLQDIRDEINKELSINTLGRLSAYEQFMDDEAMAIEERVSLAISGWLGGTGEATRKLPTSVSMYVTRNLMRQYFHEAVKLRHEEILQQLSTQEAATPASLAKLLAHMKPPYDAGKPVENEPGFYQLEAEVFPGEPTIPYLVQLPAEYDPLRPYPTVVTLHGAGSTPQQQIDWWAGSRAPDGGRHGQASRHGYIVIAPAWARPQQREYGYSAEEHAAVLNSLRDACRRFSIDTDRVFISGHSMGGDAAWDLGTAHPDLWAGMIPIAAVGDRYVAHYWENAAYVPFYLVSGQFDGDKLGRNAPHLDRYFTRAYNVTVVEYEGRGHEHFIDEIQRLFDWMGRNTRNFFPKKFAVRSLRDWDNFFWWVELHQLPPKSIVPPENWPPVSGTIAVNTDAEINQKNGINVHTGAGQTTVWLSPEIVDFTQPIRVMVNGAKTKPRDPGLTPSVKVMLEDARTRADRKHVFWAKVELGSNRVNVAAGNNGQ